ncbi:Myb_DNA-bind_4 domain-containing protein [Cephalotus follicularis]|uniref:Myb_DNA-bind_4 domain-containing protein n=1 Tax=Cephalotus follicularis TaxID=3775 RepID=A0A1Q3B6U1_CEPFO|nr:Myb_DNA-bind_4 domain-containing protein [Cephalotus follicularis]
MEANQIQTDNDDGTQSGVLGCRRTRSQVAPDWALENALILVNEYAAVEADCSNALSTYQKWKIVTENCAALGVPRTLNQCRRKWDSLVDEYNKIKQCESGGACSYWSLECQSRIKLGLPEIFDDDLFKAMDDLMRDREDHSDTDQDVDPEADSDMNDVIADLGSERQGRHSTVLKSIAKGKHLKNGEEKPKNNHTQERPQKYCAEKTSQNKCEEAGPRDRHSEEKPLKSHIEEKNIKSFEEEQQLMSVKLRENAELIHAIVQGKLSINADFEAEDSKNVEDFQSNFARGQANQLIACLGEIVYSLDKLRGFVQEYE